jgi:transposase
MTRRQLTRKEKKDIVKRHESGERFNTIAVDYGRSKRTISNVVQRYNETGGHMARKVKLSQAQKKAIVALVETDATIRLERIGGLLDLSVSHMTISAYLRKKGYACKDGVRKTPYRHRA